MRKELQERLRDEFPEIFCDLGGDPRETCMADGIAVGDGWFDIVRDLCRGLSRLNLGPEFRAAQVKEKFGTLRFYVEGLPQDQNRWEPVFDLIEAAEQRSARTCEQCGCIEGVTVDGPRWIRALCADCRNGQCT